ncbi:unnamed protein product [Onchocerca ochengi]|uniref:Succinate dehydrogenase [ubiquinone] cytochrome b small subunit n=1 Tax=Onchocerca ochengi TaxID=42157 RepID=A0A182EVG1_ONCOC|nr:unnamed protein product [Onchocerca ochengi]
MIRLIPAACGRTFSSSAAVPRLIRNNLEGSEVTYPIAGKKPKLVKDCRDAVSIIKSVVAKIIGNIMTFAMLANTV